MNRLSRREVVSGLAFGTVALSGAGGQAMAAAGSGNVDAGTVQGGIAPGKHPIVPLPFDPAKLKGLSEKLLRSHHENNYGGAVKNLNKVEEDLARLSKDSPGYLVGGLKDRELTFNNSLVLHELYFGNLGGDGKASSSVQAAIASAFGSFGRWEELFRAVGTSLAGGSGWVVLDLQLPDRAARNSLERQPHPERRLQSAAPGDGHVRARLCHRLRRRSGEVHRRVLPEHPVGRGPPAARACSQGGSRSQDVGPPRRK